MSWTQELTKSWTGEIADWEVRCCGAEVGKSGKLATRGYLRSGFNRVAAYLPEREWAVIDGLKGEIDRSWDDASRAQALLDAAQPLWPLLTRALDELERRELRPMDAFAFGGGIQLLAVAYFAVCYHFERLEAMAGGPQNTPEKPAETTTAA